MLSKIVRFVPVSLLLVGALGLPACGGSQEAGPQSAESATTRAPVGTSAHGQVKLIGAALGEVPLRPDQRTEIDQLAADADARHKAGSTARTNLANALAAQVEQGHVDRAALQPQIDAVNADAEQNRDADRAAFERLHAILTPDQRATFVDALKAKTQDAKKAHHGEGGWHRGGGPMAEWGKDLKLTDDQKKQIKDAMQAQGVAPDAQGHKGHPNGAGDMKARGGKVLDAFKTDHFVMDEVAPPPPKGMMTDRMIKMSEAVVPILTPEQRTLAAQKIRAHAAQGGHEGGMGM